MEEILRNLFIQETFPNHFDSSLWKLISADPPTKFQAKQLVLYNLLQKDITLKDEHFLKFEKNHLKLY